MSGHNDHKFAVEALFTPDVLKFAWFLLMHRHIVVCVGFGGFACCLFKLWFGSAYCVVVCSLSVLRFISWLSVVYAMCYGCQLVHRLDFDC